MIDEENKSTFFDRQYECQPLELIVVKRNQPPKTKEEVEEYLRSCLDKPQVDVEVKNDK